MKTFDRDPLCPLRHPLRAALALAASLAIFGFFGLLAACNQVPTKPQVIEVPGPVQYVPIDPKLTFHPPLPPLVTTTPLECSAVANSRLDLLGDAYRQLDAIRAIQGTSVP